MANYNCYYFGPYVKVYPPERSYMDAIVTCTSVKCAYHGKYISTVFCGNCGSPVGKTKVLRQGHLSLHDFLDKELEEDLFSIIHMDGKDYAFFISNHKDQGGFRIHQHGDYPIPLDLNFFDREDWVRLTTKLDEKGIKHEKNIGVVSYYN